MGVPHRHSQDGLPVNATNITGGDPWSMCYFDANGDMQFVPLGDNQDSLVGNGQAAFSWLNIGGGGGGGQWTRNAGTTTLYPNTDTDTIYVGAGTAAKPSYSFKGALDSGWYWDILPATNTVTLSISGQRELGFTLGEIFSVQDRTFTLTSAGLPASGSAFLLDATGGDFSGAQPVFQINDTSGTIFTVYGDGNVNIPGKLTVAGVIDPTAIWITEGAAAPGGGPGDAMCGWWGRNDTPNTIVGADDANNTVIQINNTAVTAQRFYAEAGAVGAVSFGSEDNNGTGIFWPNFNLNISMAINGTQEFTFASTSITAENTANTFTFISELALTGGVDTVYSITSTNIFSDGDYFIQFVEGGVTLASITSSGTGTQSSYDFGIGNTSTGDCSFTGGNNNTSSGDYAVCFGLDNTATNTASIALGDNCDSTGTASIAIGTENTASGDDSIAIGVNNVSDSDVSIAIGYYVEATADYATIIGRGLPGSKGENAIANSTEFYIEYTLTEASNIDPFYYFVSGVDKDGYNLDRAIIGIYDNSTGAGVTGGNYIEISTDAPGNAPNVCYWDSDAYFNYEIDQDYIFTFNRSDGAGNIACNIHNDADLSANAIAFKISDTGGDLFVVYGDGKVNIPGTLDPTCVAITEQAAVPYTAAGYGTLWVKNDAPSSLYYTDDAGTDFLVIGGAVMGYWSRTGTVLSPSTAGDTMTMGAGAVGAPTYSFETYTDSGFYLSSNTPDIVSLSLDGTQEFSWAAGNLTCVPDQTFTFTSSKTATGGVDRAFTFNSANTGFIGTDIIFAVQENSVDFLTVNGNSGLATGTSTATGAYSCAIGNGCTAIGATAFSQGVSAAANATESIALGRQTIAGGSYSIALGGFSETGAFNHCYAFGIQAKTSATIAHTIGSGRVGTKFENTLAYSMLLGLGATAVASRTTAQPYVTIANRMDGGSSYSDAGAVCRIERNVTNMTADTGHFFELYDGSSVLTHFDINAGLILTGHFTAPITTITAATYTAGETDWTILLDTGSNNVTVTLPAISATNEGREYNLKAIDATSNTASFDTTGTDTIDGNASYTFTADDECVTVVADNNPATKVWRII